MTKARTLADMISDGVIGTTELADDVITPVKLDETGNYQMAQLGIGTSSPSTPLHVSKAGNGIVTFERSNKTSGSGYLGFNVEGNSQATIAFDDGGGLSIGRSSDPSTQAGYSNDFFINSSGNVGIGEASVDSKFHVKDNLASTGVSSSSSPIVIIQNERTNTGTSSSVLRFDTNEITGTNQYARAAIGAEYDGSSNVNGRLMFSTADTSGTLQERIRIDGSGNVGIGSGSLDALEARSSFNYKSLRVQNFNINAGDSNYGFIGQNLYQDTAGQTKYIDNGYSSSIHFWGDQMQFHMGTGSADATHSNTEKMRMLSNGNIQQFKQMHFGYTYYTNNGYIDTDFTAADGMLFEISGSVNPNSGGSSYSDVFHGHIYIGRGWNGSALTHYVYFVLDSPLGRDIYSSGSSASGNDIDVVIHNNGTETTNVSQADSSNWNIRLKASNYNSGSGSNFYLNITRKL